MLETDTSSKSAQDALYSRLTRSTFDYTIVVQNFVSHAWSRLVRKATRDVPGCSVFVLSSGYGIQGIAHALQHYAPWRDRMV